MTIRIVLANGKYADLESFTAADVDVDVIATSLANQCRFGGQCHTFYSVAQHCVHAATLAMEDGHDTETVFAILMHDAAEAYVQDVVTPVKVNVPLFTKVEWSVSAVIGERFGIDFVEHSHWIKYYDSMMLRTEKEFFWPLDQERWDAIDYDIPAAGLRQLCPLLPAAAKNDFLLMYRSVEAKRKGVVSA